MVKGNNYLTNAAWMLIDKAFGVLVSFIVGVAIARYIGPEQMGVWGYVLSLSAIFAICSTLGLEQVVIRDLIPKNSNYATTLGSVLVLRLLGGGVAALFLILIAMLSSDPNITNLLVLVAFTHVFNAFSSYDFLFQAKTIARFGVQVRLIVQFILALSKILMIVTNAPLIWLGIIALAGSVCQAILYNAYGWLYIRKLPAMLSFHASTAKYFLLQSAPLILSSITTIIYLELDKVMLKHLATDHVLGNYAVASNIAVSSMFLIAVISQALYPFLVKAKKHSEFLYIMRLEQLYSATIWMAIAVGVLLYFTSSWFMPLLFGEQYSDAVGIVKALSVLGVFTSITLVSSYWFLAEGLQKYSFYRNLLGLVVNVVLNFILIPKYGAVGAAVASIAARAAATIGFFLIIPKLNYQLVYIFRALNISIIFRRDLWVSLKGGG